MSGDAHQRGELGPNAGLVDEMYRLFLENPQAVSEGWREFFADYKPAVPTPAPPPAPTPAPSAPAPAPAPAPSAPPLAASPANGRGPVVLDGETAEQLR